MKVGAGGGCFLPGASSRRTILDYLEFVSFFVFVGVVDFWKLFVSVVEGLW